MIVSKICCIISPKEVIMKNYITTGVLVFGLAFSSASACPMRCADGIAQSKYKYEIGHHTDSDIVNDIVTAVSKVGLNARQKKQVAQGIKEYRETMAKIEKMRIFPIDSFIDDDFDEKRFISEMSEKYIAKMAAQAALFKYIFKVLNKDQRKAFKNAYAAPLIEQLIRRNF